MSVCVCACVCARACAVPHSRLWGRDPSTRPYSCHRWAPPRWRGRYTRRSGGRSSLRCEHRCMLGGVISQSERRRGQERRDQATYVCSAPCPRRSNREHSAHTCLRPRPSHTGIGPPRHMTGTELLIGRSHSPDSPARCGGRKSPPEEKTQHHPPAGIFWVPQLLQLRNTPRPVFRFQTIKKQMNALGTKSAAVCVCACACGRVSYLTPVTRAPCDVLSAQTLTCRDIAHTGEGADDVTAAL